MQEYLRKRVGFLSFRKEYSDRISEGRRAVLSCFRECICLDRIRNALVKLLA